MELPIENVQKAIVAVDMPCKFHVTNFTWFYCKTCDNLVCQDCVSTSHANHQCIPKEKGANYRLHKLKRNLASVIDNLKVCYLKSAEIRNLVGKYNSIFDDSVIKIKQKERELHHAISEQSKTLQDMVETERSTTKSIVFTVEHQVDEARKKLEELKEKLEQTLTSGHGQVLFDPTLTEPDVIFDSLPDKFKGFIPETDAAKQIPDLLGTFQEMTIPATGPELEIKLLRTFTTDVPALQNVIALDEATTLIKCITADTNRSFIRKITVQDNNITHLDEMTFDISDMALSSHNEIFVTEKNSSEIKLITKSMEIKPFLNVAPLVPIGIHVRNDNHVIIGAVEPKSSFLAFRVVIEFDNGCKHKRTYQFDGNGRSLFNAPTRIITNNNQDILVIDRKSYTTGRVVSLDREGTLRWTYEGHPQNTDLKQFDPRGITMTTDGHIIVSDKINHTLHILSANGNVLTCKGMDGLGIFYPMGVYMDRKEELWVCCGTGGKDSGAKLHNVKLLLLI